MLLGMPLRYLIGADKPGKGYRNTITEVAYDVSAPLAEGTTIAYCNFFDEQNSGEYGPYLHNSDTAQQYKEGQIDPRGKGWLKNLREQFNRRHGEGFEYIEIDNPDAYEVMFVYAALTLAREFGLKCVAKNPTLYEHRSDILRYLAHTNVYGIIIEKDCGDPVQIKELLLELGKDIPVWFVSFNQGAAWIKKMAKIIKEKGYTEMYCSYSTKGEYKNSTFIT